jgi:hypothetical protein
MQRNEKTLREEIKLHLAELERLHRDPLHWEIELISRSCELLDNVRATRHFAAPIEKHEPEGDREHGTCSYAGMMSRILAEQFLLICAVTRKLLLFCVMKPN